MVGRDGGGFSRRLIMSAPVIEFDYSLLGKNAKLAEEKGLASAEWYSSPISRKRLKELMQRRDGPAIRDTLLWFALLGLTGWLGWHFWGTWGGVAAFLGYWGVCFFFSAF